MRWFTAGLLGVALTLLVQTLQLNPAARRVPLAVVIPLVALLVVHIAREQSRGVGPGPSQRPARFAAILWALGLPLILLLFGALAGPPLFVLLFMRFQGCESWLASTTGGVIAGGAVFLLFSVLLEVSVPMGLMMMPFVN